MSARIFVAITADQFARLYDEQTQAKLHDLGEVVFGTETSGKVAVPTDVGDEFDVLLTSWSTEPFDPAVLAGSRLRLAVHSAGSVRKLFPAECLGDRLRLAQGGADAMALPVAELALTFTLAHLRNLVWHDRALQRTRDWREGGQGVLGQSIAAQRIGIVSLSRAGRHFASLVQGLGATSVRAFDPYCSADDARQLGVELCELDELCATSDVLSIHAPVTAETVGMLGAPQLALLPDGAIVTNTARAQVTDEEALLAEVTAGRLKVGLDVFTTEPLPVESPFFGLDNAILTPHVAGGTVQARFAQGTTVVAEVESFLREGTLRAEVTPENYDRLS
ncbi:hydroxyacid dehydrogenase [Ruania alba]|uniref:Phosphoglycerate dehydrogenase n=1 Tax=Ruania alba TaxID=648782 RepID=A0A1H5MDM4_9MICO|nr:hydroxyacid dehydrogenase [Ruania alba]SEE86867.1 Phosphoglycerate dehydrogenase [Ruania alba]